MSMNSGTHERSRSIRLLTFEKNWCQAVLDKVQSISSRVLPDLPDPFQLKQLISILFHVSLETEEGIHPQISAIWLPLHKAERELGSGQAGQLTEAKRWVRFCQSIRINGDKGLLAQPSKHLRKLAALCDSEETLLLVEPRGSGDDELVAWGLLDIRYPLTTEAGSVKDLLELSTYPSALSVHFARPGYLEVKWNGKFMEGYPDNDKPKLIGTELGLFEAVYDRAGPRNIGEIVDLDHKPIKYREIEKNRWTWEILYAHAQILVVESMLGQLVKRKMGGTFLFVPDESDDDKFDDGTFNIKRNSGIRIRQSPSIKNEIKRWIDSNRVRKYSTDHIFADGSVRYRLRMVADWLANFASIDGSVVMSRDLRLLLFAAKTEVKQEQEQGNGVGAVKEDPIDDFTRDWLKSHGTRHNSAASWVAADSNRPCKPSLGRFALTVSQDGHVSAFYWKCRKVHRSAVVYRRL